MPVVLTPEQRVFVTERHLATLTTLRPDGTPHVTPVAFTWAPEDGMLRVTTRDGSVKVRNIEHGGVDGGPARYALCQVDGGRWLTFEGTARVSRSAAEIAEAERRYARRYRPLEAEPTRVVLLLTVESIMGSDYMTR